MLENRLKEHFQDLDGAVVRVIFRVFQAEKAKLSYTRPRGIIDEINHIIEDEVQEYET